MSTLYLIGAIVTAVLLAKPYVHARDNEENGAWKPTALYTAMITAWPLTWCFVAFAIWFGRHLKG